ncbi:C-type MBL-2 protein [Salpingoeca rosetta]|uniref:C-type MBL-2 protein n=1 Tax=Salpingoeca rosetta (strain ATCC 50818 / BSB-021) TaxID=946362 RepID=F2U591_SALR5|nr:C-type MBL-2 protein [Salpingoeca rosetta]EGD82807.1 C-type MBL-2 protein [Salpingoeca rosetta]|eukprot:XP_004996042.1 C-type MBL-2 protein [Salpingoeca rosetta]
MKLTAKIAVLFGGLFALASHTIASTPCDPSSDCCLTGFAQVTVEDFGLTTISAQSEGNCSQAQGVVTILCVRDAVTGSCPHPLYDVSLAHASLTIVAPDGRAQNATCVSGPCDGHPVNVTGVYRFADPAGWHYYEGSEYLFKDTSVDFDEARAFCQSLGADLPVVDTRQENEFIDSLTRDLTESVWLGAHLLQDPLRVTWVDGSEGIAFENDTFYDDCTFGVDCLFQKNEPNNFNGEEFCLSQGHPTKPGQSSGWNDADCSVRKSIVCERKILCSSRLGLDAMLQTDCVLPVPSGDQCNARCEAGFEPQNPVLITCSNEGILVGGPTCEPVDCGPVVTTLPANATADCSSLIDTRYKGQACEAQCDVGFELQGDPTFTCGTDGLWTASMTCNPVDCGPTPDLPNNTVADCSASTVYGGQPCHAACAPGYETTQESEDGIYTCTADGEWVGEISCTRKDCGTTIADLPVNASANECGGDTAFGGDDCEASCDAGYEPVSGTSTTFTCGTDGMWQGDLACQPVDCGSTITVTNGGATCSGSTVYTGDDCEASCDAGYEPVSGTSTTFTCGTDGMWQGDLACQPVDCGSLSDFISDAFASVNCASSTFTSTCSATCVPGYEPSPESNVSSTDSAVAEFTCGPFGSWQGALDCVHISCGSISDALADEFVTLASDSEECALDGNRCPAANVTCPPGYELSTGGSVHTMTCKIDGAWSESPTCQRVSCGPFVPNLDPEAQQDACLDFRFGDVCEIGCRAGYVSNGDADQGVFTCDETGEWQGTLTCDPVDCGPMPSGLPDNITSQCSNTKLGDTCELSCDAPFFTKGSNMFKCTEQGVWIGGCDLECLAFDVATQVGDSVFAFIETPMTFSKAQVNCLELGGNLASVSNDAENDAIFNLNPVIEARWLGGFVPEGDEHSAAAFQWVDGSSFNYTNWASGEPNDYLQKEDCTSMHTLSGRNALAGEWNDVSCTAKIPSVCEINVAYHGADPYSCDAPFELAFSSEGFFNPGFRFSTAFEPSAQEFEVTYSDTDSITAYSACSDHCLQNTACVGFYLQTQGDSFLCIGLNDLGYAQQTTVTSSSYARTGYPVPGTTSTTTTTTTTTSAYACTEYAGFTIEMVANADCQVPGDGDLVTSAYSNPLFHIGTYADGEVDQCVSDCSSDSECLLFVVEYVDDEERCTTLRYLGIEEETGLRVVTYHKQQ